MRVLQSIQKVIQEEPKEYLVLKLTLVLLLLHGSSNWRLDIPLRILCCAGLVLPILLRNPWFWLLTCIILIWGNALEWTWIDNHKYLITYWAIASLLAVSSDRTMIILEWNARLLIGLAFFFAVFWKVWGGEYFGGEFLHYSFLTDSRLELPVRWAGGLEAYILPNNWANESVLKMTPAEDIGVSLITNNRIRISAKVLSYWTLLIEGLIALGFLLRKPSVLYRCRDLFLIIFISTTYVILPVTGFAFVLALMGFAQCSSKKVNHQLVYFVIIILVHLTRIPWQSFLEEIGTL